MNVSMQNVDKVSALLTVNIEKADYQEKVEKLLKKYRQQVNMPGFRKGMVPMSLVKKMYGKSATAEEVNKLLSETVYNYIPKNYEIPADLDYLHITSNNTIYGTEIHEDFDCPVPLIADMSSDIMSRPVDVSKYAMIYGGAQKNVGPAGVHDKQALVLVNLGGAKGKDIIHLCEMIQRDVKTKFGVDIYPEVNIK